MKVKELIKKLQKENPEAEVVRWRGGRTSYVIAVEYVYPIAKGIAGTEDLDNDRFVQIS